MATKRGTDIKMDFLIESLKISLHSKDKNCHHNCKLIGDELKKLGYDVKVVEGMYMNGEKKIHHSWIEYKDKILETDCEQLRNVKDDMPDELQAILSKEKFKDRYNKFLQPSS